MKLDYTYKFIAHLLSNETVEDETPITSIAFDSRRIVNGSSVLFFALQGIFRDGHAYIDDAYNNGVRYFVVTEEGASSHLENAKEIVVSNSLSALQDFSAFHRNRFDCKMVAITGSNGKTIVKEWLSDLLSTSLNVSRSPKSYNSKLGVALSLFEINAETDVAILEVGVPGSGEMKTIEKIIRPDYGIFTSFGTAHREMFDSEKDHLEEKLLLFENVDEFLYPASLKEIMPAHGKSVSINQSVILNSFPYKDKVHQENASLAIEMARRFRISENLILKSLAEISPLALRLESYDGIYGNAIINDTYSLDEESLVNSLSYQLSHANGKPRMVIIGLSKEDKKWEPIAKTILAEFKPDKVLFNYGELINPAEYNGFSILIKGTRNAKMEKVAQLFKHYKHQTYIEFDLKAIRHNINLYKSHLSRSTKMLCMVKASSYGTDPKKIAQFLEDMGVDHLGVAYPDEGIELRKNGITLPILVMNCEQGAFNACIDHNLEPAIYSLNQLNAFIKELINRDVFNFPIHVKIETGMHRLGFVEEDIASLVNLLKGQPEVRVKSVYSHLAEADKIGSSFTQNQIAQFKSVAVKITGVFDYPIIKHIVNSAGIINHPEAHFDMVRLGIGMYGYSQNAGERESISWYSEVSQVKTIESGESVGYSRSFISSKDMNIAVIPVGYADGFRRILGNGVGGVFIQNTYCPTIGNVCMDMIMVSIGNLDVREGTRVEIIGPNQSLFDISLKMQTIPYETMTSLSPRLHRLFTDQ